MTQNYFVYCHFILKTTWLQFQYIITTSLLKMLYCIQLQPSNIPNKVVVNKSNFVSFNIKIAITRMSRNWLPLKCYHVLHFIPFTLAFYHFFLQNKKIFVVMAICKSTYQQGKFSMTSNECDCPCLKSQPKEVLFWWIMRFLFANFYQ